MTIEAPFAYPQVMPYDLFPIWDALGTTVVGYQLVYGTRTFVWALIDDEFWLVG